MLLLLKVIAVPASAFFIAIQQDFRAIAVGAFCPTVRFIPQFVGAYLASQVDIKLFLAGDTLNLGLVNDSDIQCWHTNRC